METGIIIATSLIFLIGLITIRVLVNVRTKLVSSMKVTYTNESNDHKTTRQEKIAETELPIEIVMNRLDRILQVQSEILYNTIEMRLQDVSQYPASISNRQKIQETEYASNEIRSQANELYNYLASRKQEVRNDIDVTLVGKGDLPIISELKVSKDITNKEDDISDIEEQKRSAAERIQKLRNLTYNMNNSADANNEFDAVPAYVRRNMELFGNTLTSVEDFYSKITVGKDKNDQPKINTINTFLDGKKPD